MKLAHWERARVNNAYAVLDTNDPLITGGRCIMAMTNQVIIDIREVMRESGVMPQKKQKSNRQSIRHQVKILDQMDDVSIEGMCEYPLAVIMMTTFLAVLGGANTWEEIEQFGKAKVEWLKRFLPIHGYDMPSRDTYHRVFSLLNPEQFHKVFLHILSENMNTIRRELQVPNPNPSEKNSVDGIESQGEKVPNMQTLHIYDAADEVVVTAGINDRRNDEIPVARWLLETLNLKNSVVTLDAFYMRRETMKIIVNGGADYIVRLQEENQTSLFEVVEYAFYTIDLDTLRNGRAKKHFSITGEGNTSSLYGIKGEIYGNAVLSTETKTHDQDEMCTVYRIDAPEDTDRDTAWAKVNSYIMVVREIVPTDPKQYASSEIRYYMSSLKAIDEIYAGIIQHWAFENNQHCHMDDTYEKNKDTTIYRTAFENLGQMMNLCISLQKMVKPLFQNISLKAMLMYMSWNIEEAIARMLSALDNETIITTLKNVKYDAVQTKKVAAKLAKIEEEAQA